MTLGKVLHKEREKKGTARGGAELLQIPSPRVTRFRMTVNAGIFTKFIGKEP